MSWQLAAFGLLALALAGGFAWYERSRPDARIVALVATLAAFAALGRIAFAAVPNVKPTTDIVLVAGFALGGGPGFAVGAIGGLASNFFFGQGPWTPWQMAAWGATGILGAGLAHIRRRRDGVPTIGRWPLALVCAAVGFAFTVVQDVGDWVTYSDHRLGALAAYVAQGLGFDAVHAAGCLGFALLLGPALIGSLQRFARRIEVTWIPPAPPPAAGLVLAACALGAIAGAAAGGADRARAAAAPLAAPVHYLTAAANRDGGLGAAPGQRSDPLFSGWGALGLASAGVDLRDSPLLGYVRRAAGAGAALRDTGTLERTILVAVAAGADPHAFAGHDLVALLRGRVARDGAVAGQVNLTAFALLALRAAGEGDGAPAAATRRWLVGQADRDGGYGFAGRGGASDADDTGAVLEALAGRGADIGFASAARARRRAVAWLRRTENPDGGFASAGDSDSNAQSTAWAIQGLLAAGVDPGTPLRAGVRAPLGYLSALAAPDGRFSYARGDVQSPVWVTGEALMALARRPLPLAAPSRAHVPAPAAAPRVHRAPASPAPAPAPAAAPQRRAAAAPSRAHRSAGDHGHTGSRVRRAPRRDHPAHQHAATASVAQAVARMEAAVTPLPGRVLAAVRVG